MGGLGQCGIGERKELGCFSGGTNIWRVVYEYYVMAGMENLSRYLCCIDTCIVFESTPHT